MMGIETNAIEEVNNGLVAIGTKTAEESKNLCKWGETEMFHDSHSPQQKRNNSNDARRASLEINQTTKSHRSKADEKVLIIK